MTQQEVNFTNTTKNSIKLLYSAPLLAEGVLPQLQSSFDVHIATNIQDVDTYLKDQSLYSLPDVIVLGLENPEATFNCVRKLKENILLRGLVIVLLAHDADRSLRSRAMQYRVNDLYYAPVPVKDLCERIFFLVKFKLIRPQLSDLSNIDFTYRMPLQKRLFDIAASGLALLLLSPLLIVVGVVVALESKGPVIFKSKRVGTGYRVFDFYKFRSMRQGASAELKDLSAQLNQYDKSESGTTTFVKLKNDPRITRFGKFIRKYSIDELPQLFNVLVGDMSLVGNRPLPLYEAETLTSNEWTMRFLGPAGLTGLWQVSRRGKADMSERERKKLDNFYAQNHSFWLDLKILLKTLPAAVQKEQV